MVYEMLQKLYAEVTTLRQWIVGVETSAGVTLLPTLQQNIRGSKSFHDMVTNTLVAVPSTARPLPSSLSTSRTCHQADLVARNIQKLCELNQSHTNVFSCGFYQMTTNASALVSRHGNFECKYHNPMYGLLLCDNWEVLHSIIGDELMDYLLMVASLFVKSANNNYMQITGLPVFELVPNQTDIQPIGRVLSSQTTNSQPSQSRHKSRSGKNVKLKTKHKKRKTKSNVSSNIGQLSTSKLNISDVRNNINTKHNTEDEDSNTISHSTHDTTPSSENYFINGNNILNLTNYTELKKDATNNIIVGSSCRESLCKEKTNQKSQYNGPDVTFAGLDLSNDGLKRKRRGGRKRHAKKPKFESSGVCPQIDPHKVIGMTTLMYGGSVSEKINSRAFISSLQADDSTKLFTEIFSQNVAKTELHLGPIFKRLILRQDRSSDEKGETDKINQDISKTGNKTDQIGQDISKTHNITEFQNHENIEIDKNVNIEMTGSENGENMEQNIEASQDCQNNHLITDRIEIVKISDNRTPNENVRLPIDDETGDPVSRNAIGSPSETHDFVRWYQSLYEILTPLLKKFIISHRKCPYRLILNHYSGGKKQLSKSTPKSRRKSTTIKHSVATLCTNDHDIAHNARRMTSVTETESSAVKMIPKSKKLVSDKSTPSTSHVTSNTKKHSSDNIRPSVSLVSVGNFTSNSRKRRFSATSTPSTYENLALNKDKTTNEHTSTKKDPVTKPPTTTKTHGTTKIHTTTKKHATTKTNVTTKKHATIKTKPTTKTDATTKKCSMNRKHATATESPVFRNCESLNDTKVASPLIFSRFTKAKTTSTTRVAQMILQNNRKKQTHPILDDSVHIKQVHLFLRCVSYKVIPSQLLGSRHNRSKWNKILWKILQRGKFDKIRLGQIMDGIKVFDCKWLDCIPDESMRKLLVTQLFHWFIVGYILVIIKSLFYVTDSCSHRNRLFYFRRSTWLRLQRRAQTDYMKEGLFNRIDSTEAENLLKSGKSLGVSFLRFVPKQAGFRPIINMQRVTKVVSCDEMRPINRQLADVFDMLRYITDTSPDLIGCAVFGPDDIYQRLASFRDQHKSAAPHPLYFVKADIRGCYDSIIQQKLFDIVVAILSKGPDKYITHRYSTVYLSGGKVKRSFHKVTRPTTSPMHNFLQFVKGQSQSGKRHSTVFVDRVTHMRCKTEDLVKKLHAHLFHNIVKLQSSFYRQCRGISQGSTLSNTLCHIYYAHMERGKLNLGPNDLLMRMVDDYLYITSDKERALTFLNTLCDGIPEYNCHINESKLMVNFVCRTNSGITPHYTPPSEPFPWCGMLFDPTTLAVSVDYSAYANHSIRDTMTFDLGYKPGLGLKNKLLSTIKPKCHPLFLHSHVAGDETVVRNVFQLMLLSAYRFHSYCTTLPYHHTPQHNSAFFLGVIKTLHTAVPAYTRNKMKKLEVTEPFPVSTVDVQWLCYKAFLLKLSQHQAQYHQLIQLLKAETRKCGPLLKKGEKKRLQAHVRLPGDFSLMNS